MDVSFSGHIEMDQHMVLLVDLQTRTEPYLLQQLNGMLEEECVPPVPSISNLFGTVRAKYTPEPQRCVMKDVAGRFFQDLGVCDIAAVEKQWRVLMDWRAKRVAFADSPFGGPLSKETVAALEDAVDTDASYRPMQSAAHVMIAAAKQLLQ